MKWLKGNTHAHTTNSDGDAPPDAVAAWYEEHGYDFLALSDHNVLTPPRTSRPCKLTLLSAEELTLALGVHVNALGLTSTIYPPIAPVSVLMAHQKRWFLEQAIAAIEEQGALPMVNHPNFRWALSEETLASVSGIRFIEVFNGHPGANNEGNREHASAEGKWDGLLSRGRVVFGLATDDAHHYESFTPDHANPGRGWIWIRANDASESTILTALREGDFYASTGVTLAEYDARGDELNIEVEGPAARIHLIGTGGLVLETEHACSARFRKPPNETYVRIRVDADGGGQAWTQPIFGG